VSCFQRLLENPVRRELQRCAELAVGSGFEKVRGTLAGLAHDPLLVLGFVIDLVSEVAKSLLDKGAGEFPDALGVV